MSSVSVQRESSKDLYRKMKVSQLGVMLLIRLYADLSEESVLRLKIFRDLGPEGDPLKVVAEGSRLAETISWLIRQFGRDNAVRAMTETAREILQLIPGSQ